MQYFDFIRRRAQNPYWLGAGAVVLVALVALGIRFGADTTDTNMAKSAPAVTLITAQEVAGGQAVTMIGTVRAFTEAKITSERAGRVTSVNASLGSTVAAGQVLVTLENASEQAAVLQAQGAYEAALAASSQSTLSASEAAAAVQAAESSLRGALRSAYSLSSQIVYNDIDDFFSDPSFTVPGLKLDGKGQTAALNNERAAYNTLLADWSRRNADLQSTTSFTSDVNYNIEQLNRTIAFVDAFLTLFPQQNAGERYTQAQLESFTTTFTTNRNALLNNITSIENAESSLRRAEDAAARAAAASAGGAASTADAQVKQALGSLRAAQASLAKTILRSPISGTVNNLDVAVGDFVGSFEEVALVANNEALEIVAYVGDYEREQLTEGATVEIDGTDTGIVTTIAPSVDAETKKTEVRIAVESNSIANGDTVRITTQSDNVTQLSEIMIPLSAVKFEAEDGYIFVVTQGTLEQQPVTLGPIRGNLIEVTSGLTANQEFVRDARGLTVGQAVQINL